MKRVVRLGNVKMGAPPVKIESMLKSNPTNIRKLLREAKVLENEGVEILRMAVKKEEDIKAFEKVKKSLKIPLIADIHFHYRLALKVMEKNPDCVRINPLNIFKKKEWREIAKLAKEKKICIRIGVNSGGIRKNIKDKPGYLLKKLEEAVNFFEDSGFFDIIISAKSSDIKETIEMNEYLKENFNYPIHIGLTASGPDLRGIVKSSICIGYLLLRGIGDSVRVSLTETSLKEVLITKFILQSLNLRHFFPELISCPTCARANPSLIKIVKRFDRLLRREKIDKNIKIAIMGCEVNGPGEAKNADLGIALSEKYFVYFEDGVIKKRQSFKELWDFLNTKLNELKRN